MATFPKLKTGAVAQYPAEREILFSTDVLQFIDGTEQRFRNYRKALHAWVIRLDLLDEDELQSVALFFDQTPLTTPFSFTDPWDGAVYPSCSIDGSELSAEYLTRSTARTQLKIRENWT